jgi:hypothetical protein
MRADPGHSTPCRFRPTGAVAAPNTEAPHQWITSIGIILFRNVSKYFESIQDMNFRSTFGARREPLQTHENQDAAATPPGPLFGAIAVPMGIWLWSGQGENFGLGDAQGKVSHRVACGCLAIFLLLVLLGLLVDGA